MINESLIRKISRRGFSKIPVTKDNSIKNIVGVLTAKSLLSHVDHLGKKIGEAR